MVHRRLSELSHLDGMVNHLRATRRWQRDVVPLVGDGYIVHTSDRMSFFIFSYNIQSSPARSMRLLRFTSVQDLVVLMLIFGQNWLHKERADNRRPYQSVKRRADRRFWYSTCVGHFRCMWSSVATHSGERGGWTTMGCVANETLFAHKMNFLIGGYQNCLYAPRRQRHFWGFVFVLVFWLFLKCKVMYSAIIQQKNSPPNLTNSICCRPS